MLRCFGGGRVGWWYEGCVLEWEGKCEWITEVKLRSRENNRQMVRWRF